jgi:hypothetical protein
MRPDALRQSLLDEMDLMAETIQQVDAALAALRDREPKTVEVAGVALFLANLYMGAESILVRICEATGIGIPQGPSWHASLLEMFSHADRYGLPQVLDRQLAGDIGAYRRFRHVAFHGYGVALIWQRMRPGAEEAGTVFTRFFASVRAYLGSLPPQVEDR